MHQSKILVKEVVCSSQAVWNFQNLKVQFLGWAMMRLDRLRLTAWLVTKAPIGRSEPISLSWPPELAASDLVICIH